MTDTKDVLGLGKTSLDNPIESDTSDVKSPEQEAINTIAERIVNSLRKDKKLVPSSWADVLRGLELVLKFKGELSNRKKKGERDIAIEALQEFKEVMDAFSKFEPK